MLYEKMFLCEEIFDQSGDLFRLESMDYDTRIFTMPKIYKTAIDLMFEHHTLTYSDFGGIKRFRTLVSDYEQCLAGVKSDEHFVLAGSGVSALIYPVIESILRLPENDGRREVILFAPDYPLFHSAVEYVGGIPVIIRSRRENDYLPTIEAISEAVTNTTAAILFSNPNNPTCKTYSEEWIHDLIALSEKHNLFLVSDEIYSEMLHGSKQFTHIAGVKKNYKNYVKLFGLSKDRPGMTGIRTGYCIGDERLLTALSRSQLVRNVSGNIMADFLFLLDIALRYLGLSGVKFDDLQWFSDADIKDYYASEMQNRTLQIMSNASSLSALKENPHVIDLVAPDGGNCIFFRYYRTLSAMDLLREFIEKGLAIYPCDVFNMDPLNEGSWTRVCVTKEINTLLTGISKI